MAKPLNYTVWARRSSRVSNVFENFKGIRMGFISNFMLPMAISLLLETDNENLRHAKMFK